MKITTLNIILLFLFGQFCYGQKNNEKTKMEHPDRYKQGWEKLKEIDGEAGAKVTNGRLWLFCSTTSDEFSGAACKPNQQHSMSSPSSMPSRSSLPQPNFSMPVYPEAVSAACGTNPSGAMGSEEWHTQTPL